MSPLRWGLGCLIELSAEAVSAGQCVVIHVQAVSMEAFACTQVDALDVAAAGVLEHAEPQLLTMLSGQLIAASSHRGAQEAERSGSIASAAAAAQVSTSCDSLVPNCCTRSPQNAAAVHIIPRSIPPRHSSGHPFCSCAPYEASSRYKTLVQRLASSLGLGALRQDLAAG